MSEIKPIETVYDGCRFRSRLEARYAVLFDHLGIGWEHEPQGYETKHGRYLPDFRLDLSGETVLFEVEPACDATGLNDDPRWGGAALAEGARLIVAFGMPRPSQLHPGDQPGDGYYNLHDGTGDQPGWDNYYAFCVCPGCGRVGIEFCGRGGRVCPPESRHSWSETWGWNDKAYTFDHPKIVAAYEAALSHRFDERRRP